MTSQEEYKCVPSHKRLHKRHRCLPLRHKFLSKGHSWLPKRHMCFLKRHMYSLKFSCSHFVAKSIFPLIVMKQIFTRFGGTFFIFCPPGRHSSKFRQPTWPIQVQLGHHFCDPGILKLFIIKGPPPPTLHPPLGPKSQGNEYLSINYPAKPQESGNWAN